MKKLFPLAACLLLFACNNQPAEKKPAADTTSSTMDSKPKQSEFADWRYAEIGKKAQQQFADGDIDGWLGMFADNAMYRWSSGDSLAGKTAIAKYWTDRRKNVIDSIKFTNDIWLPIKVNQPQKGPDAPGIWLLNWYQVNVRYKNGKQLMFWIHTDYHFDNNDKVDQAIQYIDRAPINAALGKK